MLVKPKWSSGAQLGRMCSDAVEAKAQNNRAVNPTNKIPTDRKGRGFSSEEI